MVDGTAITSGTHYTVNHNAATNTVTDEFTQAGRAILAAHNTTQIQVVLNATANAVGEIENTANVYPNANSFAVAHGQPGGPAVTPPVVTKWGSMTLEKINDKGCRPRCCFLLCLRN